jgi:hypothetical protein
MPAETVWRAIFQLGTSLVESARPGYNRRRIAGKRRSIMRRTIKLVFLLSASIAIALSIAGCASFAGLVFTPKKGGSVHAKGEVVVITGRVVHSGNQSYLEDQASDEVFRFVGLQKDEAATLTRLAGHVVRIRLKIISVESAKAMNAQLVAILE